MDRATRNLLDKNDKIGEAMTASMDTGLEKVKLYVNVQLPSKCADNGHGIHERVVPIKVDLEKAAKSLFPDKQVPAYAFISEIEVKHGYQENNENRRISLSAVSGKCGRVVCSADGKQLDEFVDGGTFLIMGDKVACPPMECVYDASGFTASNSIFSKYSSALERDYESNLTDIAETDSVMYTSMYNDNEVLPPEDDGEDDLKSRIDDLSTPKYDWFLGLISKNRDSLSKPITMAKKPGKTHKHVYTVDMAKSDFEMLKENADNLIFEPLQNHLIALRKDTGKGLRTDFVINARADSPQIGQEKWPASTKLSATLGVTLAYFAGVERG